MAAHLRWKSPFPELFNLKTAIFQCIRNGDLTRHNLISHIDPSQVFNCERWQILIWTEFILSFLDRCSYKSSDRKCFAKHLKYSHREKEGRKVLYECSKCPYKTIKILFFTRHMKRHGVLVDSKTAQTVKNPCSTPPPRVVESPNLKPKSSCFTKNLLVMSKNV